MSWWYDTSHQFVSKKNNSSYDFNTMYGVLYYICEYDDGTEEKKIEHEIEMLDINDEDRARLQLETNNSLINEFNEDLFKSYSLYNEKTLGYMYTVFANI